jgi:hypothetical protein
LATLLKGILVKGSSVTIFKLLVTLIDNGTVLSHLARLGTIVLQVLVVVDGVGLIIFGEHSENKRKLIWSFEK